MNGIEMSSMNTVIFLPPAGPNVRPWRFSTLASIVVWKMPGVVRLEKVITCTQLSNSKKRCKALIMCQTVTIILK